MLHHSCKGNRYDGNNCADNLGLVGNVAENDAALLNREAYPCSILESLDFAGIKYGSIADVVHNNSNDAGNDDTEKDRNDFAHTLAPDVEDNNGCKSNKGEEPVRFAVGNCAACKTEADGNNNRACNNRREVFHNLYRIKDCKKNRKYEVNETCYGNTKAGIGKHSLVDKCFACFVCVVRNRRIAAEESEGRAEEGGNLTLCYEVEEQCTQACHKQGGCNVKTREQRNKYRCAEHCKGVLETEDEHLGDTELFCVVNRLVAYCDFFFFSHFFTSVVFINRNTVYFALVFILYFHTAMSSANKEKILPQQVR